MSEQHGTMACPICGKDEPHHHPPEEDHRKVIVAWVCEIAWTCSAKGKEPWVWSDWRKSLTFDRPSAPEGSIRNLRPLYAGEPEGASLSTAKHSGGE